MSLQNLLKKFSESWNHGKAKISAVKAGAFPKNKNNSFIYRNKREIVIIFASVVIVMFCAASITYHVVKRNQRREQFAVVEKTLENKNENSEKKSAANTADKKKKRKTSPAREAKAGILNDEVLLLLNGSIAYPVSNNEQFSANYIEMYPLNNYNLADTNLIIDEYDKIIEQSIKDSCTFNFERRRK